MNFELTPEQKAIQAKVRMFAQEEVAPLARETDETGEFPIHLVKRMGELGFLAGPIAASYGGSEMDYLSFTLISETEIQYYCTNGLNQNCENKNTIDKRNQRKSLW